MLMVQKVSIRKTILTSLMVLTAQTVMASNMTVCPTPEMMRAFKGDYISIQPMSFDQQTGAMTLDILQSTRLPKKDGTFAGYGKMNVIISGVVAQIDEDPVITAQALWSNMQLDSDTPFLYKPAKDVVLPVCSYSLPGEQIKAVVYQTPDIKISVARG